MSLNNQQMVKKAAITAANDLASAGKLNPEQSDRFIDYVFDESVLPAFARIVKFRNEQSYIEKIGVGARVAVPKEEARDPGVRRGISTSRVTLQPQEIMLPVEISDNFKEHNIEGDSVENTIMRMFARKLNNDLEELYIHGNTGGPLISELDYYGSGSASNYRNDAYLALFDGFLQEAAGGNVVDAAGASVSSNLFRRALSAMPTKFKRNKRDLKFLVPVEIEELWRERVASRATAAGDAALNGAGNLMPYGIELVPVPLMQMYPQQVDTLTFTGSGTSVSLSFGPIQQGSVVIMSEADAASDQVRPPYTETTDYTVDYTTGVVTHAGGGSAIGANEQVRISYRSMPQMLLTMRQNLIIAFGRDITLEQDRDIYRTMDQFAMTVKADVAFEELTAVVHVQNISDVL